MRERRIEIAGVGPGTVHTVPVFAFGDPRGRPHVHVQGGIHADEGPGMLAARTLVDRLAEAEAADRMRGRVTVIPAANPIGLGQVVWGDQAGRFDLLDGRNFNRDYPDLAAMAAPRLVLGADGEANVARIRAALAEALEDVPATVPADILRKALLREALPADIVLDLHCDGEAVMHLYTTPNAVDRLRPLIALLNCEAVLVAEESGGNPFDEALSRPWIDLARQFPNASVPAGGIACTVELRGRADVDRCLAAADAEAIMGALVHWGAIDGTPPELPEPCPATPLAGSEALEAPRPGLVSYTADVGDRLDEGDLVAEIVDPASGAVTPVRAGVPGVFFARPATRVAEAGKRLGKIAGPVPIRGGNLLSP